MSILGTIVSQAPQYTQLKEIRRLVGVEAGAKENVMIWGAAARSGLRVGATYAFINLEGTCTRKFPDGQLRTVPRSWNAWTSCHILPLDE